MCFLYIYFKNFAENAFKKLEFNLKTFQDDHLFLGLEIPSFFPSRTYVLLSGSPRPITSKETNSLSFPSQIEAFSSLCLLGNAQGVARGEILFEKLI